jgi:DNA polymerase-3 subunit delta'
MLARGREPGAILFTGARGVGKFTLARMFAQAANCQRLKDDFCGECDSCRRIGRLADPKTLIEQALTERGESADAGTADRVPLIVETHPDVWAIFPDPARLRTPVARPMIRVSQLRAVQRADTMRYTDADVFLKILEEPPESATLILIAASPDSLLPTIRSRCLQFHFAPVPAEKVEEFLSKRTELKPAARHLAAQLSCGSPGIALEFDLEESERLRREVLRLIELAYDGTNYREIFAATAQLAKQEKESFENVLELFYSLLTDLLELSQDQKAWFPRNPDLRRELEGLGKKVNLEWVANSAASLDRLHRRLRRNVSRQLGLDAVAISLYNR